MLFPTRRRTTALAAVFSLALLAPLLALMSLAAAQSGATSPVFINELHYDNTGGDTDEGVEIAGPAGTDLAGWTLVFYNGNGGAPYGQEALSGTIDDEGGGYGALSFPVSGLQNGSPDGVALVDATGGVVQFLSYEGSFTAIGGPADGVMSSDIGVAEVSSTPIGDSLQLTGSGTVSGDFTWSGPTAASAGSINADQSFDGGGSGDAIAISEIRIDQSGSDTDEMAELVGPANGSTDGLTYLVIGDGPGGSGVVEAAIDLTGQGFDTDGFLVLGEATLTTGTADLVTVLNFENSDNVTHLVVRDFTGASDDDLDTDDDGTLDVTPWSEVVDLIALVEEENPPANTEFHYGPPSVGPDGSFVPGHVYVCDGEWVIGEFNTLANDTPGAANACDTGGVITFIHDVQGNVPAPDPDVPTPFPAAGDPVDDSPLLGQIVTIEGIVTGWDDEAGQSNSGSVFHNDRGFFVQEEDTDADGDPRTSEGIFVQFSSASDSVGDYQPGDKVQVTGVVAEHFEWTVIGSGADIVVVGSGSPLPSPTAIVEPIDRDGYEALESMVVNLPVGVANSGGTNRFGELMLTPGPDKDLLIRPDDDPGLVALDSDAGAGNPMLPRKPTEPSTTVVRADLFATVNGATGPLAYTFDLYKILIQPDGLPTVTPDPTIVYPYDRLEPSVPGQVRVTALNVENFFPEGVEFDGSPVSAIEYANKRDRIVDAVDRLLERPEIVGVEEVYNLAILQDVASQLGGYTAYLEEGNDNRGIDVGFLIADGVDVLAVEQFAATEPDIAEDCGDTEFLFDRPPLQVDIALGPEFGNTTLSVINNHFSSKAAVDACRDAQAAVVRDRAADLEESGNEVIVTGDLNAFEDESPLAVLTDGTTSLRNLWFEVPADEAYSFQFTGRLQTLDHLLVSDGLDTYSPELVYAHFDTNYYNRQWDEASLETSFTDGHGVSDHDPPVLTLTSPFSGQTVVGGSVVASEFLPADVVEGVRVNLYTVRDNGKSGRRVDSTTTDASGLYRFSVDPGCWIVEVRPPSRYRIEESNGRSPHRQTLCAESGEVVLDGLSTLIPLRGNPTVAVSVTAAGVETPAGVIGQLFSVKSDGSLGNVKYTATSGDDGLVAFTAKEDCYALVLTAPDGLVFEQSGSRYLATEACVDDVGSVVEVAVTLTSG